MILHTQFCYKVFIICQIFTRDKSSILINGIVPSGINIRYRLGSGATFLSFNIERKKTG